MEDFSFLSISYKVKKMGVLYTNYPKMPGPSPNFLITSKNEENKIK
jgi:hypothetical protein